MIFICFKTFTCTDLSEFNLNWFMKDFQGILNIFYERIQFVNFSVHKGFSSKIPFFDVYFYLLITAASLILISYSYSVALPLILVDAYT